MAREPQESSARPAGARQHDRKRNWHPAFAAPERHLSRWFRPRAQSACQWLAIVILIVQPTFGRADTITPEQVQSGSLLIRMQDGYRTATALDTDVSMNVSGLVARVVVRQRFENRSADWAEGVYVFPLPETAAVDHMRFVIGERIIEGEIREKEQARREYERAKAAGQRTSLVEQERPNLFTTSVANIAPGETVVVEIEYLEELRYTDGLFTLRFPLTLTPRYMPGERLSGERLSDERLSDDPLSDDSLLEDFWADKLWPDRQGSGWAPDTTRVADASRISPPVTPSGDTHRVTMSIELDAGMPLAEITSRYHPVTVTGRLGRHRVELAGAGVPMDHDFELAWRPAGGHAPQAMAFAEALDGEPHFLLMIVPPSSPPVQAVPRELIFVVDTSGSMHGTSIGQARAALRRALEGLTPADRFNLIEFNSLTRPLFPASVPVTAATLADADRFAAALAAEGGTEMRPALELALRDAPAETHLRQLVFITDGAVGNEDELFALIEARLGAARLFTIGIGSAPNSWFMRKAAEAGRGTFTMISALEEVGEKMDRLFAKLEQPQVTGISVEWPPGVTAATYPSVMPDLYADEPVSLRARISGPLPPTGTVLVSGNGVGGVWRRELSLGNGLPTEQADGIAALWARGRLDELADEERRGSDPASVRTAIVDLALKYHLVSKYTSLVAVDKTPARVADELLRRDLVANRLPYGQSMEAIFGFPATATDGPVWRLTGAALLLLALLVILAGRAREIRHAAFS